LERHHPSSLAVLFSPSRGDLAHFYGEIYNFDVIKTHGLMDVNIFQPSKYGWLNEF
jgi:hypothetical protein